FHRMHHVSQRTRCVCHTLFFFHARPTTESYTLSLHDALPIYENGKPVAIDAVVLSTQHSPNISLAELREAVLEEVIKPVLPAEWLHDKTLYHINPTGNFVIGGPMGDCGLTGRKIIVDSYGGMRS